MNSLLLLETKHVGKQQWASFKKKVEQLLLESLFNYS